MKRYISLFALLIILSGLLPQSVSAAWYNGSWAYRKSITVTNASADYQTLLRVYYGAGTDHAGDTREPDGAGTLTADAGTNTTTIVDAALSSAVNNYYVGATVYNSTRTSVSVVTAYVGATKTMTISPAITSQTSGDTYYILDILPAVYTDSLCQTDFDDIRFTGANETTLLDYCIKTKTDSTVAYIWVQNDATPSATIYIYYGNVGVATASSGSNTFIVYDDFERGVNGDAVGGSWTVSAGSILISTDHSVSGTRSAKFVGAGATEQMSIPAAYTDGYRVDCEIWKESAASLIYIGHGDATDTSKIYLSATADIFYYDVGGVDTTYNAYQDQWILLSTNNYNFVANTYSINLWGFTVKSATPMQTTNDSNGTVTFNASGAATQDYYLDNVIVRKYTSTEPSFSAFGAKEDAPTTPVVTTQAVTTIGINAATLNGNITSIGIDAPDERGFVWDVASQADPGDTAPAATAYGDYHTQAGTFAVGAFTYLNELFLQNTTYYVRAYAHNSVGYSYGAEVSFTTVSLSTYVSIQSVNIFQTYKTTGDWLIGIRYVNTTIPYYDTYDIRRYFVAQLCNAAGTVVAQSPLTLWGNKVTSLYLSSTSASALEWGNTSYSVRITGLWGTNPYVSYTLTSSDWLGTDLTYLDSWVISSAGVIETYYSASNLVLTTFIATRGEVLNATGGTLFDTGVPGLSSVRPNLFQTVITAINPATGSYPQTTRLNLEAWQVAWGTDGTIMLTRMGDLVGATGNQVAMALFLLVGIIIAVVGFAGSGLLGFIMMFLLFLASMYFGTDWIFIVVIASLCLILFWKQFIWKY